MSESALKRELASLYSIRDHHPKFILTLDEAGAGSQYDGIRQLNALDWLLGKEIVVV
jgi:hypothetical protein